MDNNTLVFTKLFKDALTDEELGYYIKCTELQASIEEKIKPHLPNAYIGYVTRITSDTMDKLYQELMASENPDSVTDETIMIKALAAIMEVAEQSKKHPDFESTILPLYDKYYSEVGLDYNMMMEISSDKLLPFLKDEDNLSKLIQILREA